MNAKSTIRSRVEERVNALGESAITLAKSVGLERGFINDILIGRKVSIRQKALPLVAKALQCDPEYILGKQNEVRRKREQTGLEFGGVCEAGVWRSAAAGLSGPSGGVPLDPDRRYPGLRNLAFDVRGDGLAAEGVTDGMTVTGIEAAAWEETFGQIRSGLIVVARQSRANGSEVEISLRRTVPGRLRGEIELVARPPDPNRSFPPLTLGDENVKIIAIVTRALRLFLSSDLALD